jgi:hypothetical protein
MYVNDILQHPFCRTIISVLVTLNLEDGLWQYNDAYTTTLYPNDPYASIANAGKTTPLDKQLTLLKSLNWRNAIIKWNNIF